MVKWIDCIVTDLHGRFTHVAGSSVTRPNNVYRLLTSIDMRESEVYHPFDKFIISRDLNKW